MKRDTVLFDTDETVRPNSSVEKLAKLRPAFRKNWGRTVFASACRK